MVCRLDAPSRVVGFEIARPSDLLSTLLTRIADFAEKHRTAIYASGLLSLAGGGYCSLNIILDRSLIIALCVECNAETYKNDDAWSHLLELLRMEISSGFLEFKEYTREMLGEVKRQDPESFLKRPLNIKAALISRGSPEEKGRAGFEKLGESMLEDFGMEVSEFSIELAGLLMRLLLYSSLINRSRNVEALIDEGLRLSRGKLDRFYKVSAHFHNGEIYSIFIYNGSLCSAVLLRPGGIEAGFLRGANRERIVKLLSVLSESSKLERATLYEVNCQDCADVFVSDCKAALGSEGEAPQERVEVEEKREKHRGLFGRLFRRRH